MKKLMQHPLFSGGLIMVGGSMLINVINYLYHLIIGRLLGPVDYGILASLFSILYIVGIIPSSASVAIVKFISSCKNIKEVSLVYKSINRLIFTISLALSVLMILVSPVISSFLHIDNIILIMLISPILFFSLITLANQATSQGLLKFMGYILPSFISSIVKLLFGILFITLGSSVFGAMGAIVLGAVFAYLISIPSIKEIANRKLDTTKYDLKPFLKYSLPVLVQALAFTSIFTVDVILVKHYLSPFDAGIYAALSTLGKIIFFASSPVSSAMFPIVSNKSGRNESYLRIFVISFVATILIGSGITFLYWLLPEFTIGVLYGKDYLSAKSELVFMGVFVLFYSLSNFLLNFSLSISKTKIVFIPLVASIAQPILIYFYHKNISEIIKVSMFTTIVMFLSISIFLIYNFAKPKT